MPNITPVHSSDKLAVSRDFLIRQSVLNALNFHFPWGMKQFGTASVLRKIERTPRLFCNFSTETCAEFRKLTGTYREIEEEELEIASNGRGMW